MKTRKVAPEEMQKRVARFKDLGSYQEQQTDVGVPLAVLEAIAARRVYPVMAPADYKGRSNHAPVKGHPGLVLSIAESPPGDGAGLHVHEHTVENFFCLSGRFRINWGDKGEHSLELGPLDMCSVPEGVMRSFTNVSNELGRLLVMIQPVTAEQADRIAYSPDLKEEIAAKHGGQAVDALASIGIKFDAGVGA